MLHEPDWLIQHVISIGRDLLPKYDTAIFLSFIHDNDIRILYLLFIFINEFLLVLTKFVSFVKPQVKYYTLFWFVFNFNNKWFEN